jgi:hypothetical protein
MPKCPTHGPDTASLLQGKLNMPEVPRVLVFTSITMEDNDWDGPHPKGELLTYTARTGSASLTVKLNNQVVFDHDFGQGKTIVIDDDVIHLPEGAFGK